MFLWWRVNINTVLHFMDVRTYPNSCIDMSECVDIFILTFSNNVIHVNKRLGIFKNTNFKHSEYSCIKITVSVFVFVCLHRKISPTTEPIWSYYEFLLYKNWYLASAAPNIPRLSRRIGSKLPQDTYTNRHD